MKDKLFCGSYTTSGEAADTIYINIIDGKFRVKETLLCECTKDSFENGDFSTTFIRKTALAVAKHYNKNAFKIIKKVTSLNTAMRDHQVAATRDPFHYFDNAGEIAEFLSKVPRVTEGERNIYNLFASVQDNLRAFTKEIYMMDDIVALRLGYPRELIAEEKEAARKRLEASRLKRAKAKKAQANEEEED